MKKFTIFIAVTLICALTGLQAQTNLYFNDFESYTAGGKVAQQAGAPWTTWSLTPGGTDDPVIDSVQAHSGTKSIFVANNKDLVFQFYDRTDGRYIAEWYMFVQSGKLGYFNFLSDFAGSSSKWAFQAFLASDSIFIDANGANALRTPYPFNTWNRMQLIIDLDDDFATLYVNNAELISYQWSKGAQGTDNLVKLDGINFYGWNEGGVSSSYWIDDLNIDSVAAPAGPFNLDVALNGADIDVIWQESAPAPELYKLSRNGAVVFSGTDTTYTDVAPWPNTYYFMARARHAGEGYSHASNVDSATIAGGVTRDLVLFEGGTGTWCQYCPGAAMGLRDLIDVNHKDAVAIEYHWNDSFENAASVARLNYYSIANFPTMVADGKLKAEGGSGTQSLYPGYLQMYNQRIDFPSHHVLDIDVVENSPNNFTATILVEQTFEAFSSGFKLHAALTESNIAQSWYNQSEVDFACRAMFPDENGTTLDFSAADTQTVVLNFSTSGYVKNNCEFVVFVQHHPTKEVTQTSMVDMASVIGMAEKEGMQVNLYPNPASEYFIAQTAGKGVLELFDMTGKLIMSTRLTRQAQTIDISNLVSGLYFVKVSTEENTFTKKLVIR